MEKVMVTGGCGFIGSHIVDKLLDQSYEVIVVDNLKTGKLENIDTNKVTFYNCDITSLDFVKVVSETRPKYIIHQAAQVSVPESIKDIVYDTNVNIKGSINVIEAAKNNGVKKIVFASSAAVYGEPQYLPVDINHDINPLSPYGLSKYTVEKYLKLAKDCYGIEYTVLRYSNVYGPRQDAQGEGGVVAIFSEKLSQNQDVTIFGNGEQTRDFIYVEDVANANVQALEKGNGLVLNVSTSQRVSLNNLFEIMKEYSFATTLPDFMDVREGDIKHSVLCNKLTIKALNWSQTFSLDEGIKKTIAYDQRTILA